MYYYTPCSATSGMSSFVFQNIDYMKASFELLWKLPPIASTNSWCGVPASASPSMSAPGWTALAGFTRFLLLVFIICLVGVSGIFLLSQAVRTTPDREWTRNGNAFVIGASYAAVVRQGRGHSICLC
jgi:hypothetical protein